MVTAAAKAAATEAHIASFVLSNYYILIFIYRLIFRAVLSRGTFLLARYFLLLRSTRHYPMLSSVTSKKNSLTGLIRVGRAREYRHLVSNLSIRVSRVRGFLGANETSLTAKWLIYVYDTG